MKKIFSLVIILCLAFSLFACAKAPDAQNPSIQEAEADADILKVPFPEFLDSYVYTATDLFTATVTDSKKLKKNYFENYTESKISDIILYTVEVESVLRDFSVAENTKVYVARFVREADERSEKYFKPFEIGKTYLILGYVKLIDNKPVIHDNGRFSVEILEDGTLAPLSLTSENLFKDTKTYNDFLKDEDVKDVIENYDVDLPSVFFPLLKTKPFSNTDAETDIFGVVKTEKEEIRKQIRDAIPIDSEKTIEIPEK